MLTCVGRPQNSSSLLHSELLLIINYCLFFQLAVEIDSILNREGGMDAEVQANIQQLAQKLYENVSAITL